MEMANRNPEAHAHLPPSTLQSPLWPQGGGMRLFPCAESHGQAVRTPPIICFGSFLSLGMEEANKHVGTDGQF